ncbi:hypothetical protein Naga_100195g6 [Nannochloropsis gaditana]|uniref:Uncharacterized protein n=1 Tax=Nannochloropsis gaditana TaxID=72520 RepID=W7T6Y2_9STRA|nr:hypothetical protein Naga_100195g6 [Nannochloropsis gaditana]
MRAGKSLSARPALAVGGVNSPADVGKICPRNTLTDQTWKIICIQIHPDVYYKKYYEIGQVTGIYWKKKRPQVTSPRVPKLIRSIILTHNLSIVFIST